MRQIDSLVCSTDGPYNYICCKNVRATDCESVGDGGFDPLVQGEVNYGSSLGKNRQESCTDGVLREYFCNGGTHDAAYIDIDCPDGCDGNTCLGLNFGDPVISLPPLVFVCGDGVRNPGEDCDGEEYCTDNCEIAEGWDCEVPGCSDNVPTELAICPDPVCTRICVDAGSVLPSSTSECCGLAVAVPDKYWNGSQCVTNTTQMICSTNCGNGICDSATGEDRCNCFDDCGDVYAYAPPSAGTDSGAGYEAGIRTQAGIYGNPFGDTDITTPEGQAARDLYSLGIIGGYDNPAGGLPLFDGGKNVNRAEAAKFLLYTKYIDPADRDSEIPLSYASATKSFKDVSVHSDPNQRFWYVRFVHKAADLGIINGYNDGTFRPANPVNVAEFLKMLSGALYELDANGIPNFPTCYAGSSYSDVPATAWYAKYVPLAKACGLGLDPEGDNILDPARTMTRDEVAVAINQHYLNCIVSTPASCSNP